MIGPIRGTRLPAEIKLQIVRESTLTAETALRGSEGTVSSGKGLPERSGLAEANLLDRAPVADVCPHRLTEAERTEILAAADEEELAHLRHRKLTHHLSRTGRVFCSESSVLRVLRAAGKVPIYTRRPRPVRPRPELDASAPNRSWSYDFTTFPTRPGTTTWFR